MSETKTTPPRIKKNETRELLQEIQNRSFGIMGTLDNIDYCAAHYEENFKGAARLSWPENYKEIKEENRLRKLTDALKRVEKILYHNEKLIGADCLPTLERESK